MRSRMPFVLTAILLALTLVLPASALAGKPSIMKGCTACHEAEKNTLRGKFVGFSEKFKTVQVNVGKLVWVVKYDDMTNGLDTLSSMKKNKEMKLVWTGTEKKPIAKLIKPKPPLKVADEKQVSFRELKALIQKSPAKGKYTLIDSRPPAAYMAGHIPYATSLPYPKLKKKQAAALPREKDNLLVFYCGGFA